MVTSAHSSDPSLWRKLIYPLRKSSFPNARSGRPKRRGLRAVYPRQVRDHPTAPPAFGAAAHREARRIRAGPPVSKICSPGAAPMFGMKADTSSPGERVISVTLANSQLL